MQIKDLSYIRDVSDNESDLLKIDSVVGGHKYYGHYGDYSFIDKSIKNFIKDFFGQIEEADEPEFVIRSTVFFGGITLRR